MSESGKRLSPTTNQAIALGGGPDARITTLSEIFSIIPAVRLAVSPSSTPMRSVYESAFIPAAYLQNQMAVALGGRLPRRIVYGERKSQGASNDLQRARVSSDVTRFA